MLPESQGYSHNDAPSAEEVRKRAERSDGNSVESRFQALEVTETQIKLS